MEPPTVDLLLWRGSHRCRRIVALRRLTKNRPCSPHAAGLQPHPHDNVAEGSDRDHDKRGGAGQRRPRRVHSRQDERHVPEGPDIRPLAGTGLGIPAPSTACSRPSPVSRSPGIVPGCRLRPSTWTSRPASRRRATTRRPSDPVPPVARVSDACIWRLSSIWLSTRPRPFASPATCDPRQTALVWPWWAVFSHLTIVHVSFLEALFLPGSLLLWASIGHARSRNIAGTLEVFRFVQPFCSPGRRHRVL